jgi:hypothetical protein
MTNAKKRTKARLVDAFSVYLRASAVLLAHDVVVVVVVIVGVVVAVVVGAVFVRFRLRGSARGREFCARLHNLVARLEELDLLREGRAPARRVL